MFLFLPSSLKSHPQQIAKDIFQLLVNYLHYFSASAFSIVWDVDAHMFYRPPTDNYYDEPICDLIKRRWDTFSHVTFYATAKLDISFRLVLFRFQWILSGCCSRGSHIDVDDSRASSHCSIENSLNEPFPNVRRQLKRRMFAFESKKKTRHALTMHLHLGFIEKHFDN